MSPILASLRPHQWTKNLVVLAPLALSKHLFEPEPLLRSVLAFVLFCGLSGVVYLVNDVADFERDRLHPSKRLRPVASGAVSRGKAMASPWSWLSCLACERLLGARFAICAVSTSP
jgi:4-hydroxybenzoate polyprenyltransferase